MKFNTFQKNYSEWKEQRIAARKYRVKNCKKKKTAENVNKFSKIEKN